ncbi:MAG: L-lactate dehydrogenase [Anaerolineae bacterium]|nr:L-lactate dehydrogenase [Anaerolineae bacterium]
MKVGIVGSGLVGSTSAYAMVMKGIGREIVLVDINMDRAKAEAADILHAVAFAHPIQIAAGDYAALAGANVVVITAGIPRKPGDSRLDLLKRNAGIFEQMVPEILKYAPGAALVVVSNPVDIMTHLSARIAERLGVPKTRVVGSGTTLDTARFRAVLGGFLGVDPQHVHGYVIGEHGDSEMIPWSQVRVGTVAVDEYCLQEGLCLDDAVKADIEKRVRYAGADIIKGKGATHFGIGSAVSEVVATILYDRRAILSVGSHIDEIEGIRDVTVSTPCIVSGRGIVTRLEVELDGVEREQFRASIQVVRDAIAQLDAEA